MRERESKRLNSIRKRISNLSNIWGNKEKFKQKFPDGVSYTNDDAKIGIQGGYIEARKMPSQVEGEPDLLFVYVVSTSGYLISEWSREAVREIEIAATEYKSKIANIQYKYDR
jgi:hypothetical protein